MTKHFLDIGGNVGQTFDYLATLDKDYRDHVFWIFEPSPRHMTALLEKCREMSTEYDIRVCPFALGSRYAIKQLYEKDDALGDSLHGLLISDHSTINVYNGYEVHVAVVDISEFILTFTKREDSIVLDIDAEGSEYAILKSLTTNYEVWRRISEVMVEWHMIDGPMPVTREQFSGFCTDMSVKLTNRGSAPAPRLEKTT